jgi:hypothetical protein
MIFSEGLWQATVYSSLSSPKASVLSSRTGTIRITSRVLLPRGDPSLDQQSHISRISRLGFLRWPFNSSRQNRSRCIFAPKKSSSSISRILLSRSVILHPTIHISLSGSVDATRNQREAVSSLIAFSLHIQSIQPLAVLTLIAGGSPAVTPLILCPVSPAVML